MKGQRGSRREGVYTVAGSTSGLQSVWQRHKVQTFKAAGAEIKEAGTRTGSEESGKEQVN